MVSGNREVEDHVLEFLRELLNAVVEGGRRWWCGRHGVTVRWCGGGGDVVGDVVL